MLIPRSAESIQATTAEWLLRGCHKSCSDEQAKSARILHNAKIQGNLTCSKRSSSRASTSWQNLEKSPPSLIYITLQYIMSLENTNIQDQPSIIQWQDGLSPLTPSFSSNKIYSETESYNWSKKHHRNL